MPTKPTGRPRGRPKGSRNVPKIDAFVAESLTADIPVPKVTKRRRTNFNGGIWATMSPEERVAYSARIRAKRRPDSNPGGRKAGVAWKHTAAEHAAAIEAQKPIIARIMKKMADNGQLPDDPRAVEAIQEAMTVLRSPISAKDKIAAARLVLDFTKAKPTAKVEHTIRSAEDILDDMADDDPE